MQELDYYDVLLDIIEKKYGAGSRVMRNMTIMTMTNGLEELFVFFKDYGDIAVKDFEGCIDDDVGGCEV